MKKITLIISKNKPAFIYSLIIFIILRVFFSMVLLIGIIQPSNVFPANNHSAKVLSQYEEKNLFSKYFLAPWYRWDTTHYIELSDYGYDFDSVNTVWPPLYPFFIKLISFLIKPSLLAALLVSNLFTLISFILLYLYTQSLFSEETAKRTLFFLAIYPTSFFLIAGYTESLFLTCSIAVFMFLQKKNWLLAGLMSALATLVRNQGILLIIPILFELYEQYFTKKQFRSFVIHSFSLTYAPFVYVLFSLYVRFGLNENWPWVTLSKEWGQHFGWPWEGILGNITALCGRTIYFDITLPLIKILSVLLTLSAFYFLWFIRHKIPVYLNLYSWATLFLILGKVENQSIMVSTIRYLLVLFPVFISQALIIKNSRLVKFIFMLSTTTAIILMVLFYWWVWVA